MKLRVQDWNFEMQRITIHDGKGQKDRTLPLPEVLVSELKRQIEAVGQVHQNDLENEFAGTFLPGDLMSKYKNAAKEFSWQWLFPAKTLTDLLQSNPVFRGSSLRNIELMRVHFFPVKKCSANCG